MTPEKTSNQVAIEVTKVSPILKKRKALKAAPPKKRRSVTSALSKGEVQKNDNCAKQLKKVTQEIFLIEPTSDVEEIVEVGLSPLLIDFAREMQVIDNAMAVGFISPSPKLKIVDP